MTPKSIINIITERGEDEDAIDKLISVLDEHRSDGFQVSAVRVPTEVWEELIKSDSYIRQSEGESIGRMFGTNIIVDNSISEPVADDVTLTENMEG